MILHSDLDNIVITDRQCDLPSQQSFLDLFCGYFSCRGNSDKSFVNDAVQGITAFKRILLGDHDNNLLVCFSSLKIRLGRHPLKVLNHFTGFKHCCKQLIELTSVIVNLPPISCWSSKLENIMGLLLHWDASRRL